MFKIQFVVLAFFACAAFTAHADNPACQRKAEHVRQQISDARALGQTERRQGLERALDGLQANCTDAGLIKAQKEDIADQREDVDEIVQDIAEKQAAGKSGKVVELQRKLARERAELQRLEDELKELESVASL